MIFGSDMFESAEIGHKTSKEDFDEAEPRLRKQLLDAQFALLDAGSVAVVVLINGIDGAGKGETINLLNKWMDPRHLEACAFDRPSSEEAERPYMWRFWRALPPRGKIAVLFGNWYSDPIRARVEKRDKQAQLDQRLDEINRFEAMLGCENVVLVKLWFHLSKRAQKKRLTALASDPLTRWRVTAADWRHVHCYHRYRNVAEHVLRRTSSGSAPWIVVDGEDERFRALFVGRALLAAISPHADGSEATAVQPPVPPDERNVLTALDFTRKLGKRDYRKQLEALQGRLALLTRDKAFAGRSLVLVFEGADAAGKGGAIRRVIAALDVRTCRVIAVGAPNDEERARPYLWRFWRQLPRRGKVVVFDRSWYGRVLVERVEGYCAEADWMRAYAEINDFEDALAEADAVVVKFWLAISKDEQLARFRSREAAPHKRFKITDEDWRNREKWDDYERAVCDMIDRTSTETTPWTLVEAEDKRYARVKILETVCERLATALGT